MSVVDERLVVIQVEMSSAAEVVVLVVFEGSHTDSPPQRPPSIFLDQHMLNAASLGDTRPKTLSIPPSHIPRDQQNDRIMSTDSLALIVPVHVPHLLLLLLIIV